MPRPPGNRSSGPRKPSDRKPSDRKPSDRPSSDRKFSDRKSPDRKPGGKAEFRKPGPRKPGDRSAGPRDRRDGFDRPPALGGRDAFRVAGFPAVAALFATRPQDVERLFLDEKFREPAAEFCRFLGGRRRPFRFVGADELAKIAGSPLHGGIVAVTRPPEIRDFDPKAAEAWATAGEPLVILDGVGNPHNLGAIVRTLAFFGLKNLVISDHPGQAGPSEAAFRVAEGGMEYVTLFRARNLPKVLADLKARYRIVGTALTGGKPLAADGLKARKGRPVALLLGNEEQGLPPATVAACEAVVMLPGTGRVQSLNVAATAAILAFLLAQDRGQGGDSAL
jgi:TrmH RNA methyltransferase